MKRLIILCSLFTAMSAKSQTWKEWLQQKKTKLKYITEQIAAYQVYAGYLKKGYDIVKNGWTLVNDIKHGGFDLHNNYFNSLKEVNGAIRDYGKVNDIASFQVQILQINDGLSRFTSHNEFIQSKEKIYINSVMANLLDKCAENLDQLTILTTTGYVTMKDNERLRRIDNLYTDMQDKYSFAKYFQKSVKMLALSRTKKSDDINISKLLYGIK
jgi:hypothetical protein